MQRQAGPSPALVRAEPDLALAQHAPVSVDTTTWSVPPLAGRTAVSGPELLLPARVALAACLDSGDPLVAAALTALDAADRLVAAALTDDEERRVELSGDAVDAARAVMLAARFALVHSTDRSRR